MDIAYRASQFFRSFFARPKPQDMRLVDAVLPPHLVGVFLRMSPPDQLHGIRVLQSVRARGEDHPALCAAALLHDVGKSCHRPRLWDRVIVVLGSALFPDATERWGQGVPRGCRRPFVIAAQHPRWGAEMIRTAGGSQELATLVQRHQEKPPSQAETEIDRLLLVLHEADGEN